LRGRTPPTTRLGRVCTTISATTATEAASKAARAFALGSDIVELRADLLARPADAASKELSHLSRKSVITVRRKDEGGGFDGPEDERLELISSLAKTNPLFIDVELRTAESNGGWLDSLAKRPTRIVSWHDFAGTKDTRELKRLREEAAPYGDVVKIVTTARSAEDNWKVLRLYQDEPKGLIAFCMGGAGMVSRLVSLQLGSPISYAALPDDPVAPGQLPVTMMVGLKRLWEGFSW